MRSQHIWKERDAAGRKREVRVTKFGGVWRFQAKYADESEWTYYERPLLDDLQALKDVVFRKYQRRRASAEDVASIEKLIHNRDKEGNEYELSQEPPLPFSKGED